MSGVTINQRQSAVRLAKIWRQFDRPGEPYSRCVMSARAIEKMPFVSVDDRREWIELACVLYFRESFVAATRKN